MVSENALRSQLFIYLLFVKRFVFVCDGRIAYFIEKNHFLKREIKQIVNEYRERKLEINCTNFDCGFGSQNFPFVL